MRIVDATAAHLSELAIRPACTCRAWAILDGDTVVGLYGFFAQGLANVVFTEITPTLRRNPRIMLTAGWRLMAQLSKSNRQAVAYCDRSIEASERFLRHFGFAQQPNGVFSWPT